MSDIVYTQHVARYMWTVWTPEGEPDLSPLSLSTLVLPTIRAACERSAEDIIEKSKNLPPEYNDAVANPLTFMFDTAFDSLDNLAFKLLKKVFADVQKTYYTVTFQDPTGRIADYTGYAPSYSFYDLENLIKERGAVSGEESTASARTENLKMNACKKISDSVYRCTQPVSCRTMCAFWDEPEEGQPDSFQCYFQVRNKEQKGLEDAFLCASQQAQQAGSI